MGGDMLGEFNKVHETVPIRMWVHHHIRPLRMNASHCDVVVAVVQYDVVVCEVQSVLNFRC